VTRRFGPFETRHDSWLPVDAPPEARAFGYYNWRYTEGWWREIPEPGPKGSMSFSLPPVWPKVATCFLPAQATDDFKGWEVPANERDCLRWVVMHRYPAGVSPDEGEDWFLNTHAKEACSQNGLWRFFSARTTRVESGLPGTWPQTAHPPADSLTFDWARVSEYWYESFDDWRDSVLENPPDWTAPPWAKDAAYPFLTPGVDFVSTWLLERPTDEFWRDARGTR
jgi:hypothetical protein